MGVQVAFDSEKRNQLDEVVTAGCSKRAERCPDINPPVVTPCFDGSQ